MGANPSAPLRERPKINRFKASIPSVAIREGTCYFQLKIQIPGALCRMPGSFPSQDWTLERRYNEFCDLHAALMSKYGNKLPELPPKSILACFQPNFIDSRRRALEVYLDEVFCIVSPHLKVFQHFLDIPYWVVYGGIPTERYLGEHTKLCVSDAAPISCHIVSCILSYFASIGGTSRLGIGVSCVSSGWFPSDLLAVHPILRQ